MDNIGVWIVFDNGAEFSGGEIINATIRQQVDEISIEIPIDTIDVVIETPQELNIKIREGFRVYQDGEMCGRFYVEDVQRQAEKRYKITGEDAVSLLDSKKFLGGRIANKNVGEYLSEIFDGTGVSFSLDYRFRGKTLTGYLPICSCRDALMQVAFALQAIVSTSTSDIITISPRLDYVVDTLPPERIRQGQVFEGKDNVTFVTVYSHKYSAQKLSSETISNSTDITLLYVSAIEGEGDNILVKFDQGYTNLQIKNGTIYEYGDNWARIRAGSSCKLGGWPLTHSRTSHKMTVEGANEASNKNPIEIKDAYLVSDDNVNEVLQSCFDYYTNTYNAKMQIVEGKYVEGGDYIRFGEVIFGEAVFGGKTEKTTTRDKRIKCGERITVSTEYLGNLTGRVIEAEYDLTSGINVKNIVLSIRGAI